VINTMPATKINPTTPRTAPRIGPSRSDDESDIEVEEIEVMPDVLKTDSEERS
jgi:hypothetical protein